MAGSSVHGSIVAEHDFEAPQNTANGGSGWGAAWTTTGSGSFIGGGGIDGSNALGLYGSSQSTRSISPTIMSAGTTVTMNFSLRAAYDINTASGSIMRLDIIDGGGSDLLSFQFANGSSGSVKKLEVNDGGSFFAINDINFSDGAIYDFSFSSDIGSSSYSFSVDRRGSAESFTTSPAFTYSGGRTTNSIGGFDFIVNAPAGSGNDGFIDSVSVSSIPEISSPFVLFGMLVGASAFRRRRSLR